MTQTDVAREAGISRESVARIESDARLQYGATLLKVAGALGVSVADIAGPNQRELAALLDRHAPSMLGGWLGLEPDHPELNRLHEELAA
jgi:transcriptional regulator with XRE-family HTH domain